jgi:Domain of unknown function (DUF4335)
MNPSSFNQNFRRYSQDTCDLMIEDKKSPFPTWMNFNKPNPLKFSLGLTDPDRPEQSPIRITGDRGKLDSLHLAVDDYVKGLLAKAPLPQLNIEQTTGLPAESGNFKVKNNESAVNTDRPIDALNITGDQPHLEADGLCRHLLYLGNIATDNQVMVSLTTLQLFDLASTLTEGVAPVENLAAVASEGSDFNSAVVNPPTGEQTTVEIVQPEVVPTVTSRFSNNIAEPRVVKSVGQSNRDSEEFSSVGSESAIRENSRREQERFKLPSIGLNNFTNDSPESSPSPISSIWPWLGVGAAAAGIIGLSLFGGKEGNIFASKPAVKSTPIAQASTALGEFQPGPVPMPSGIENSPNAIVSISPTPSSTLPARIPGTSILTSPSFSTPPGLDIASPKFSLPPSSTSLSTSPSSLTGNIKGSTSTKASPSGRGNTTDFASNRGTPTKRFTPNANIPVGVPVGNNANSGFPIGNSTADTATASNTNLSPSTPTAKPGKATKRPVAPANVDDSLPGSVAATGDDLFAPVDPKNSSLPIEQLPTDNNASSLEATNSQSAESSQATETQSYFQKRWKADPNFSETLQYVIRLNSNGKVGSITPQGDISKNYLDKTRFLRTSEQLVSPSRNGKGQDVRVILKPNGEVETIVEP